MALCPGAVIISRSSAPRTGSGDVYIVERAWRALFGTAAAAVLVNTAVLNGDPVTSNFMVTAARADGSFVRNANITLACHPVSL